MRFIILLLILASCEECYKIKQPIMTISNAIPIQFWVNGVETFNEKSICGVEPVCFCQPFNCDDEIRIQFTDTSGASIYNLQVLDSSDNELHLIAFEEVSNNTFQVSFIPQNYSVCDEKIKFKIFAVYNLMDSEFLTTLDGWQSVSGFGGTVDWVWGSSNGGCAEVLFTYPADTGNRLKSSAITIPDDIITDATLTIDHQISGTNGSMTVRLKNISNTAIYTSTSITGTTSTQFTIPFATINEMSYIEIAVSGLVAMPYVFRVNDVLLSINQELAQSDCIDIKTSHECTVLLEYTNANDFNGIVYVTSPTSEFNLRIPAQFWKEDNPMEQEDSTLSNGVIKTRRQTIEEKTLLEIGYLPNYMHKKIQLALMHDTVTIEGNQWKKRDAYEGENTNRYPLKKSSVWLTLYNSIEDNIL